MDIIVSLLVIIGAIGCLIGLVYIEWRNRDTNGTLNLLARSAPGKRRDDRRSGRCRS